MKRRKLTPRKMSKSRISTSGSSRNEVVELPNAAFDESRQVHPGVVVVDGCEVPLRNTYEERCSSLPPRVAELSLNDRQDNSQQDVDFNDRFPDEILLSIFKHIWRPVHSSEAAKVCKRWYILLARNQLQQQSIHPSGAYPCIAPKRKDRSGRDSRCNGSRQTLKLSKIESEFKLSMDFVNSCRRHTHSLGITDCTHVSVRGYQLIAAFASNLKSVRLESCSSMDDPSLDTILDRCACLRSLHLYMVPELTLKNLDKKAPFLQELHVYGCTKATGNVVFSLLKGCPNLRVLGLSGFRFSSDWAESMALQDSYSFFRLQNLKLANTTAVTDDFVKALTDRLPNLRNLNLTNCSMLSDRALQRLNSFCLRGLQRLVVTSCRQISDDSVRALASAAANLQDLSLAGTSVSDAGVEALMRSDAVGKLRNLSLACCREVTDEGLRHFVSGQSRLTKFKTLDVQNCPEVSIFGLRTLRNSMRGTSLKVVSEKSLVTLSK